MKILYYMKIWKYSFVSSFTHVYLAKSRQRLNIGTNYCKKSILAEKSIK